MLVFKCHSDNPDTQRFCGECGKQLLSSEEKIADDIDMDLGKITTSSPEAFKYYSEWRKYILKGNNRKSIELMKKAVAIDPEFATAYRSLAASYGNLCLGKEWRESRDKALELSDRVSVREQYLIQGYTERGLDK